MTFQNSPSVNNIKTERGKKISSLSDIGKRGEIHYDLMGSLAKMVPDR